jgi:butyryl-CoA dehydrogenase
MDIGVVKESLAGETRVAATPATVGRLAAASYFFHYELPKIGAWLNVVETRDPVCAQLPEEAF